MSSLINGEFFIYQLSEDNTFKGHSNSPNASTVTSEVAVLVPGTIFYVGSQPYTFRGTATANGLVGFYATRTHNGKLYFFSTSRASADEYTVHLHCGDYTLCFYRGTRICTPRGEIAVEDLRIGDLVYTTDCIAEPIRWIGYQTVVTALADPLRTLPIRIGTSSLADGIPARDLLVSPGHALLINGILIQAGALVNDITIRREKNLPVMFMYYHIELDGHRLILAEQTPAETFVDSVDRTNFDNYAEYTALYPDGKSVEEMSFPRAKSYRQVPVEIKMELAVRHLVMSREN